MQAMSIEQMRSGGTPAIHMRHKKTVAVRGAIYYIQAVKTIFNPTAPPDASSLELLILYASC